VLVGLNVPHIPAFEQVTVHLTPLFVESLDTTAVSNCVEPLTSKLGGGGLKTTEIANEASMVMLAEADFVGSETEVAVTVTVLPAGTADGAV
jgi:hypothetical protein